MENDLIFHIGDTPPENGTKSSDSRGLTKNIQMKNDKRLKALW